MAGLKLFSSTKSGKLSRLNSEHLTQIELSGDLKDGDPVAPFGSLNADIIEFCLYDLDGNYITSSTVKSPFPDTLDVGDFVRGSGYRYGTYKVVFNFLRRIGGTGDVILVKPDKTIYKGKYYNSGSSVYAGTELNPTIDPDTEEIIELRMEDDSLYLQDISTDRTELRIRPNPNINDPDANERFRLLGYTCLCQADINGESPLTFDNTGKVVTVNWVLNGGQEVSLNELMKGGTLIIRDAFVIDYDETPETISTYIPDVLNTPTIASNNLVTNGHFNSLTGSFGDDVAEESNSNPKNEIVEFSNPGHSKWCLRTTPDIAGGGTKDVKYQMNFEVIPGETYVLSCWVYHDENWNGRTDAHFHSRAFIDNVNGPTITGVGTVLETKVVDGNTWERQYSRITVPETGTGKLIWYLGFGIEKDGGQVFDGYRYYTDLQCEPGSAISLPTPYISEERLEDIESPVTGLVKFVDDNTLSATLTGEDAGFVELMSSDTEGRGSGKVTIKDAIVTDQTFDMQTDRTIVDEIPTDNADASVVREGGNETEFNKSPFHGNVPDDSTDLEITIQANDIYRLNKVNPDGNEEEIGRYDIPVDVTVVDEVPVETSMAPEAVLNEGEVHQSTFHGEAPDDSTDLQVTLHANDIYRLMHIRKPLDEWLQLQAAIKTAEEIESDKRYRIITTGTTDFTDIGARKNAPNISFVATGEGTGTGTVLLQESGNSLAEFDMTVAMMATLSGTDAPEFDQWAQQYLEDQDPGFENMVGEYNIPVEVREIDDLEIVNAGANEIRENRDEGEWHITKSPYHGVTENKIILQVDDRYDLYRLRPNGQEILIGSHDKWKESKEWSLDSLQEGDRLRVYTYDHGGAEGFVAKVYFNNQIYRTGDPREKFRDSEGENEGKVSIHADGIWDCTAFQWPPFSIFSWFKAWDPAWWDISEIWGSEAHLPLRKSTFAKKHKQWKKVIHPELEDCRVIWPRFSWLKSIRWEWEPGAGVYTKIWKHFDPDLNVRAVHPKSWSAGQTNYDWNNSAAFSHWRTGWIGHQAKWINGEGHSGGPAMKFIDQNSIYQNPNHPGYNGRYFNEDGERIPDHTADYGYGNKSGYGSADHSTSLRHRWQGISQTLPFSFQSQGIQHGDKIKISWWQKSDTIGKGASVYLRYWKVGSPADGNFWGSSTKWLYLPNDGNFVPVKKDGEWEKAEYILEVPIDFDLGRMGSSIYGDANKGPMIRITSYRAPEGIVWVSDPKITLVTAADNPEVVNTYNLDDFKPSDKLKLYVTNLGTEPRGILAKVNYRGTSYKTGDKDKEYYYDDYAGGTLTVDLPGTWQITDSENRNWTDLGEVTDDKIDPELQDTKWIWSVDDTDELVWEWSANTNVVNGIWNYPDPVTYDDAITITGWNDGFNPFHWGGIESKQDELFWHSGWTGHHAKWVRNDGQFGACMKFVDMNSSFTSPNHIDYEGQYKTGYNAGTETTLAHRDMFMYADLPNKLASQGIQEGSFIKISWWQKTSVEGKGAKVGLRHFNKDGQISWGPDNEFYKMIPCTSVDEWEQVSYTGVVDEDWDLTKTDKIYVKGHFGPEGMLWVEGVTIEIVSGIAPDSNQVNTYTVYNFNPDNTLKLYTTNLLTEPNGFIAKVNYRGTEYKTGDTGVDYYTDPITEETTIINLPGTWKLPGENWKVLGDSNINPDLVVDPNLSDSKWVGNVVETSDQQVWNWSPLGDIGNYIWNYPDPSLRTDAVWPTEWSNGFDNFDYGGDQTERFWHTGWIGHHAKFVPSDGQDGETAMKFIDQNSLFDSSNHSLYPDLKPYKTGNSVDDDQTLKHRPMKLSQKLPHTMAAQGVEVGDQLTISWRQKSDSIGKGARIGIRHFNNNGNVTFGDETTNEYTNIENTQKDREWLRYIPTTTLEWQDVSYSVIVDEDFDLTQPIWLCVYGHKGPEGMLWVENIEIKITIDTQTITVNPVLGDFVAEIGTWVDKNTITIKDGYDSVAGELGHIFDNNANIRSWNTFTDFSVEYTSSVYSAEPIRGSLRAEIESVEGDNIINLVNSFEEHAIEAGHDLIKYSLDDLQSGEGLFSFANWFIQYPIESAENLSKLVRLGRGEYSVITNFKPDVVTYPKYPHSVVYKLYEPLPAGVGPGGITIVKEMIPPIQDTVQMIPFSEEWVSDTVLRTPEPFVLNSPIGSGQTEFRNYNQITSTDSDIQKKIADEILSGSFTSDINLNFAQFSDFIHFSSAEQRVKNFKYKLDLIEQYTDRSASLAGAGSGSVGAIPIVADPASGAYLSVSGSESPHPSFTPVSGSLTQIQSWEKKRRNVINNFDKLEKFMFEQSSSYTSASIGVFHDNSWPKRQGGSGKFSDPYVLYRTSQSLASDWYTNQIVSASDYDKSNKNRLSRHLPSFVMDDTDNTVFLKFIDMVGHHFDDIWLYIKSMTDVHDRRDKLTEGIAKDLLLPVAQSFGWDVQDGKDLISLQRYLLGMEQTGSEAPWQYSGTPERDISREIWSRIINNMPFFLKTKGTARAIKGLIGCYGIPSSVLRVMEYGGPKLPGQPDDFVITRKFTKALNFFGATNNTYVQNDTWEAITSGEGPTGRVPDTVEFRFKAASGSNQVLVRRGSDWAIRLKDNGSSDRFGNVSFMLSGSKGYLEVSSSALPVYDNEFWSVMLTRTLSGSGNFVTSDTGSLDVVYSLYTKQYDVGRSKIIYESKSDLLISGSEGVVSGSYNLAYVGTADTITLGGPQENTYFGESLSGSMMEYRHWTTALNSGSFDNHVAAPIAFDGNTPSASYIDLVTRYSFDDDKDLSVGANQWFQDVSADQSFTSSAVPSGYSSGLGDHFSSVVDETKMKVPNLGPSGKSSNKIRIESDTLIDRGQGIGQGYPILKFKESITTPAYDNAPIDSNKLGIYFSPSKAIDEDIISSMPNIDFDQYIGDPRDQYKEQYTGLTTARNLYWKKYSGPNNFWDYMRLLKYYDNSLYKQLKTLVPARANATIGILIEPTVLERDKIIIGKKPTFDPEHYTTDIDLYYVSESARYTPLESGINYSHPFNTRHASTITDKSGSYISQSSEYIPLESNLNYSHPFRVNFHTQESGSYLSASSYYMPLESDINYSHPFGVNFHTQESGSYLSASSEYLPLESDINYSHPFRVNFHTQESGSFISASSYYMPLDADMYYTNPFRVNSQTQESGSFISASALYEDMQSSVNLHDPWRLNDITQLSGSGVSMSADFSSLKAPSDSMAANANGTGSFVLKHILERPSLFGIGDRDESGWYGSDYYNSTIQRGSQKSIFEEVVMPRVLNNVESEFNREVEHYYSSSLSASLGIYYSSSFKTTDLDNRWDEAIGTDRLFYLGCVQTDDTTISDAVNRWRDNTPAVEVTLTSPTVLVTTDDATTQLDVQ